MALSSVSVVSNTLLLKRWNPAGDDMGRMEALQHAEAIERGLVDIGRAARESGVSVKMIRHYEAIGLLSRVARTSANYRLYTANDVHIAALHPPARDLGFSTEEIKELLGLGATSRAPAPR